MPDVDYLLIGGGLAALHAAKQIRKADPAGSILIATEEPLPPYDRPPLSKEYLRGQKTLDEIVYDAIEVLTEQGIEVSMGRKVESLDAGGHVALLAGGEDVHFRKALLATGGRPITLSLPGSDLASVHYLRTAADADAIAQAAARGGNALVIGGGFIGLEVAASLRQCGLDLTVVEALPRVWSRFADETLSSDMQRYLSERGVRFLTSTTIAEFRGEGRVQAAVTGAGDVLSCDLVCIGVGIVPNVELALDAGLAVDNGIVVDEYLRTSQPDIYAAGDVISYPDRLFGRRRRVEHWGHAEASGQIAGRNMAGGENRYDFLSYVWSDIFDLHLEFAGDESGPDAILRRGSFGDGPSSVLYLRDGRLRAFFAVNVNPRELAPLRRLIQTQKDLSGREAELQDASYNLRQLV